MPTRDRPAFASQAIEYFLRQDYPDRELIIVDDGATDIADLVPRDDSRVRYFRSSKTSSVGEKRNYALDQCRGELVAHWDDDDWIAPSRLSRQVNALQESGADVAGLRSLLYYKAETGEAWNYAYPEGERPWLAGGTLLYRRALGIAHRFPDITVGEDTAFLRRLTGARLHAMTDPSFYVGIIHESNTSGKNTAGPCWQRGRLSEIAQLLAHDRDFYAGVRAGKRHAGAMPAQTARVSVVGFFDVSSGYGSMSEYTVLGMARAGAAVDVMALHLQREGISTEFQGILKRSAPDRSAPTLYCGWPQPELQPFLSYQDLFLYTMWESAMLPAGWAEQLNRARAIIVPSRFVARTFRESGVTVPIEIVPEGIDPDVYPYVRRETRFGLTTLIVGPLDDRKHVAEGIAAWKLVFANDPEARLIIKTSYGYHNYRPDDPRIRYVDHAERTRGILHWYRQADVLLALGNEGFGLPLVEAMASGLPVIALNSEGQADVCAEARDYVLPVDPASWQVYNNRVFGRCGLRGVPGVGDVAEKLRWVDTHRAEAQGMGAAASAWAHRNRNVWNKGPAILDVMEKYSSVSRPLRRSLCLWTTSFGQRCGVAEYTASLAGALTQQVRTAAQLPILRNTQLLHIQHENGLFQDVDMISVMHQAADARVPVVVTEHSIDERPREWERQASALISLSARGADTLRKKWPGKRVEHIPHGCQTWFPPRKVKRARVIGVLGFLERHKGFWRLLDVLRRLPGTELLMFSYARGEAVARAWNEASEGLPVRRVQSYLPEAEIARRLADEADILAFPYDEVDHISVSGAVRIGLASGVPILCSRTRWFEDLEDITYQPPDLCEGVVRLLEDSTLRNNLTQSAKGFCYENSWSRVAEKHHALWRSLVMS